MKSPAENIKDLLVAADATKYKFAVNLFVSSEPTTPVDCITVYDTGGITPAETLDGIVTYNDTVQVLVRNKSYQTGWDIAMAIVRILLNVTNVTLNTDTRVLIILPRAGISNVPTTGDVTKVGQYQYFSTNFIIRRQQL
jgi:hypothetical protein